MCLEVTRVVLSPFRIRKCKTVTSHVSQCCVQCADSLVLLGVIAWQRYTNSRLVAHLKEVSASPSCYPPPQKTKGHPFVYGWPSGGTDHHVLLLPGLSLSFSVTGVTLVIVIVILVCSSALERSSALV